LTLAEIRQIVRDLIPEPSPRYFSDAELNRYINLGNRKFSEVAKVLDGVFATDLFAGTRDYSLDSLPFIEIKRVSVTDDQGNSYKLRPITLAEMDDLSPAFENASSGIPAFYYMRHNQLMSLFPAPSYTLANGLTAIIKKIPNDLVNDDDIPEIPRIHHEALVYYAVHLAKMKDQEYQEAQVYLARFNEIAMLAKRDYERVSGDLPEKMRQQEIIEFIGGRKR